MTTPLVLLGLAILAGAVVWVLSVRQSPERPPSSWEPAARASTVGETTSAISETASAAVGSSSASVQAPAPASEMPPPPVAGDADDRDAAAAAPRAAQSFAYVPLGASDGLTAKTRLLGIAGLIALIVLTSAAVAFGVWMLGHAIGQQLSHFATG